MGASALHLTAPAPLPAPSSSRRARGRQPSLHSPPPQRQRTSPWPQRKQPPPQPSPLLRFGRSSSPPSRRHCLAWECPPPRMGRALAVGAPWLLRGCCCCCMRRWRAACSTPCMWLNRWSGRSPASIKVGGTLYERVFLCWSPPRLPRLLQRWHAQASSLPRRLCCCCCCCCLRVWPHGTLACAATITLHPHLSCLRTAARQSFLDVPMLVREPISDTSCLPCRWCALAWQLQQQQCGQQHAPWHLTARHLILKREHTAGCRGRALRSGCH